MGEVVAYYDLNAPGSHTQVVDIDHGLPVQLKDGADATQGAKANAPATDSTSAWSVISLLKAILAKALAPVFPTSSTGVNTNVAASAADILILAANANRRGATVYNDSTATLSLLLGATVASTTNFTTQILGGGYYEVPFGYTGQIRGLWATATGSARMTELT